MNRNPAAAALSLLHQCARPGCPGLVVDPKEPCGDCLRAFGTLIIRRSLDDHPQPHAAAPAAGPLTPQGPNDERRRNQTCWICEQRRTCRRRPHAWECEQLHHRVTRAS